MGMEVRNKDMSKLLSDCIVSVCQAYVNFSQNVAVSGHLKFKVDEKQYFYVDVDEKLKSQIEISQNNTIITKESNTDIDVCLCKADIMLPTRHEFSPHRKSTPVCIQQSYTDSTDVSHGIQQGPLIPRLNNHRHFKDSSHYTVHRKEDGNRVNSHSSPRLLKSPVQDAHLITPAKSNNINNGINSCSTPGINSATSSINSGNAGSRSLSNLLALKQMAAYPHESNMDAADVETHPDEAADMSQRLSSNILEEGYRIELSDDLKLKNENSSSNESQEDMSTINGQHDESNNKSHQSDGSTNSPPGGAVVKVECEDEEYTEDTSERVYSNHKDRYLSDESSPTSLTNDDHRLENGVPPRNDALDNISRMVQGQFRNMNYPALASLSQPVYPGLNLLNVPTYEQLNVPHPSFVTNKSPEKSSGDSDRDGEPGPSSKKARMDTSDHHRSFDYLWQHGASMLYGAADYTQSMKKHNFRAGGHPCLPKKARHIMLSWLKDHRDNPYPSEEQKAYLVEKTTLSISQLNYWFVNARRRVLPKWRQMEAEGKTIEVQLLTDCD